MRKSTTSRSSRPSISPQFDGVMMMTNGNLPFTEAQKKNLLDFVRSGKGFIGAHCASLTFYDYPEFGEMLGGYFHRNLPQGHDRGAEGRRREASGHEDARRRLAAGRRVLPVRHRAVGRGAGRTTTSTCCSRTRSRWASRATACTCCSASTPSGWICRSSRTWCAAATTRRPGRASYGKGRSFYTSLGHRDDIWSNDPVFRAHIAGGIRWALGLEQ